MNSAEAAEMYKEHILDLYKHPHNFGSLENANISQQEHNPLCGDELTIDLIIEEGKVKDIKFRGKGCAISIASTSLLTDHVKGKTIQEIKELTKEDLLEMLQIPIGPVRLKCALLCLQTIHNAIQKVK